MKFSLIIPVYNIGDLVHKSIGSVLHQLNGIHELIVVDDGSTDNSGFICDTYSCYPNVKIIHKENGGLSSARNAGIEVANGDYLLFLDGDDYLLPESLKILTDIVEKYPTADFIQYNYKEVKNYLERDPGDYPENVEVEYGKRGMFERMLNLGGIGASACTKIISKKALGGLRFTEGIIHEDEDFTIRLIDRCNSAIYIDSSIYMYVWREGSIITQKYTSKRIDIIPILNRQISILEDYGYSDLALIVKKRLFQVMMLYYVGARKSGLKKDMDVFKSEAIRLAPSIASLSGNRFSKIAYGLSLRLPMLQLYYLFYKLKNKFNNCNY